MEKLESNFEGIISPSHPPIIGIVSLAATATDLKSGTVLKVSSGAYAAAGNNDTPVAILLEDVPGHSSGTVNGKVLLHGLAVESRLLNSSQEAPDATLLGKLHDTGIYLTQAGWDESNYN